MFAAKNIYLGRCAKAAAPTARSYVQDGLISHWDGIENSGYGIHTSGVTRWENLADSNCYATGQQFKGTAVPYFDENGAVFSKNNFSIANSSRLSSAKYIDILFKADSANNNYNSYLCEIATANVTFRPLGQLALKSGTGSGATLKTALAKDSIWLFSADFSTLTASVPYVNGDLATYNRSGNVGGLNQNTLGRGYWADNIFLGHIYCVRLYSRALAADEIAANYAIDKERFNLP